jgi:hypothetical protein
MALDNTFSDPSKLMDILGQVQDVRQKEQDRMQQQMDMGHQVRSQRRMDLLTNALTNFVFSLGQGLQASAATRGPGSNAAGAGAALQGPMILQQMRQQQAMQMAQRQAEMMRAQAAQQNAQTTASMNKMVGLKQDDDGIYSITSLDEPGAIPVPEKFAADQVRKSTESAARNATALKRIDAVQKYRDLDRQMKETLQSRQQDFALKQLQTQTEARKALQKDHEDFLSGQNDLNRQNHLDVANLMATAKKGIVLGPEDVGYIADQVQRDASLLGPLTSGNQTLKAQVIADLQRRGSQPLVPLTVQTKNMAQSAKDLVAPISELRKQLDDPNLAAKLGPVMGRWNDFLAGKIGTGDPDYQYLRAFADLVTSGVLRAHFGARGGVGLYDKFAQNLQPGKMTPETLKSTLDAWKNFLTTAYMNPVYGKEQQGNTAPSGNPFRK